MDKIGTNVNVPLYRPPVTTGTGKEEITALPNDRIELSPEKEQKLKADPKLLEETIQKLPKVDIHRHLEGAIKPETILRIAEKYGIELPAHNLEGLTPYVCITDKDKTLVDFLQKFNVLSKLWVNEDAIKEISKQCVLDAKEENVKAMELRFAPTSMAKGNTLPLSKIVDAVLEGVREGEKETGIVVGLTTIIPRQKSIKDAMEIEELTKKFVDQGKISLQEEAAKPGDPLGNWSAKLTSLDLACDESHFPAAPFAPVFLKAEEDGIDRKLHAGEAAGAESVRSALKDCHAETIGHGIRSFEDPELVKELIDNQVTLEMCPTSNEQTGAVDSLEHHPLKKFYDMGGRSTINTDDPGVSATDLNKEYMVAINRIGCKVEDVENMILYAVDAMFVPPTVKAALHSTIREGILKVNREI